MTTDAAEPPRGRAFLDHFPTEERSLVANVFLAQVRRGACTVRSVLDGVQADCHERQHTGFQWHDDDRVRKADRFLTVLFTHDEDARAFAAYQIWWESLPRAVRDKLKNVRGGLHQEQYLKSVAPTEKQLAYLASLRYGGEPPASRYEASALIDRFLTEAR